MPRAHDFAVLIAGRVLFGISAGGFWAIGAAAAGRLVLPQWAGRVTALVFAGASAGTVIGLPAGSLLGGLFGWRIAFVGSAGLCAACLVVQLSLLPRLSPITATTWGALPAFFRKRLTRVGLGAVALVIAGHFAAYTYITPFLAERAAVSSVLISAALLAYGIAGLIGNTIAGELVQRHVRGVLTILGLMLGATILLLPILGTTPVVATALVVAWGFAFGGVPVSLQTWMFKAAPDLMESGGAVFVSAFQLSLAVGSLAGGVVVDHIGIGAAMTLGGFAVLAMSAAILVFGKTSAARAL